MWIDLLFAVVISQLVAIAFVFGLRVSPSWGELWFLILLFLAAWSGVAWIPAGPTWWGTSWAPGLVAALLVALLVAALVPSAGRPPPGGPSIGGVRPEELGPYYWTLVGLLAVSAMLAYV